MSISISTVSGQIDVLTEYLVGLVRPAKLVSTHALEWKRGLVLLLAVYRVRWLYTCVVQLRGDVETKATRAFPTPNSFPPPNTSLISFS